MKWNFAKVVLIFVIKLDQIMNVMSHFLNISMTPFSLILNVRTDITTRLLIKFAINVVII